MPKGKATQRKKSRFIPYVSGFRPPTEQQKSNAITVNKAEVGSLPKPFDADAAFFPGIPKCTSIDDWLAQYKEEGQTYSQFLTECPWLSARKWKSIKHRFISSGSSLPEKYPDGKIYVMPIGNFNSGSDDNCNLTSCYPDFDAMIEYTEQFFGMSVTKLPVVKLSQQTDKVVWVRDNENEVKKGRSKAVTLKSRYNAKTGRIQLCVDSTLIQLGKYYLPDDAICMIALTMFDLYQDNTDLFVAGMAAGNQRVAIFSLQRYDPNLSFSKEFWYKIEDLGTHKDEKRNRLMLQRSCRLLVHELCHLLGLGHCIYYACCMNGSGHLDEDFSQPMYLCPVDLRKLQKLCAFDVVSRYQGLLQFFTDHDMEEEADWTNNRLTVIQ